MMFPHHHQGPHFSTSSRSFRRPPSSQLPRPSIFFASTNIPSYIGSSSQPISPFGTLPRRMSLGSQIGIFCRPIHPMDQQPPEQQQQPYCTVEEIKEGKRQRARRAEEENHYEEQEEGEGEGNGRKGTKGEEDGDSSDDDYYGLYERAPESRPNSSSELKVQPSLPLPPPLPPPIIPFAGKNGQNGGWKKQQQKQQQKLEQHSPKEKIFKRRMSRTKLALFLLPLLALCSLLLVLPLLLLWLLSVPSMEWPSNLPENRPKPKPIEWNGQNRLAGKGAAELVMEPEKLAEWMGTRENAPRLRIFEVREGHRREKESPPPMDSSSPSFAPFNVRPLQIGSLSHNGVPVHPLQFQRLLRSQSVDSDSLVILVDRHPLGLLAAYALWIFRLYGHEGAFMLNGGFGGWQEFMAKNAQNLTLGQEIEARGTSAMATTGTFRAEWRHQMIATFDDLLANFDLEQGPMADIADAQSPEEFEGKMASSADSLPSGAVIFGHIRTAVNIPVERLFRPSGQMLPAEDHSRIFAAAGFSPRRPIVVYDGFSSFRAAALWTALNRANYSAALYFGAWPEWLIRAPDHLKIIPDK